MLFGAKLRFALWQLPQLKRVWDNGLCDSRVTMLYPNGLRGLFPAYPRVRFEAADRRTQ